jgi:hypothetical protein
MMKNGEAFAGCVVLLLLAAMPAMFALRVYERVKWDTYAREHHCTVRATSSASVFIGGQYSTLQQTCWMCEPGPLGTEVCR